MTGTDRVNSPKNDGNADRVTGAGSGDDTDQPSVVGQAYLAQLVVAGSLAGCRPSSSDQMTAQ